MNRLYVCCIGWDSNNLKKSGFQGFEKGLKSKMFLTFFTSSNFRMIKTRDWNNKLSSFRLSKITLSWRNIYSYDTGLWKLTYQVW